MNTKRILLVDDEVALLDGLCRHHRKQHELVAACGPEAGLKAVMNDGPFAAVVTDFQMPGMNGIEFLDRARELRPDMIPVMLTGQADLRVSIEAVNRGQVFRFLTKPAKPEDFRSCLDAALEQYQLRHAERVLLEDTVRGSVEVLTEILALCNPVAFGRATRIRGLVRSMAVELGLSDVWKYETAALLSQIGCVAMPDDVIDRSDASPDLADCKLEMFESHPLLARDLLKRIPRFEEVAEIIGHQRPATRPNPAESPVAKGGRILSAALELDELLSVGAKPHEALRAIKSRKDLYPEDVLAALSSSIPGTYNPTVQPVPLNRLRTGMVIHEDVRSRQGVLIVAKGHQFTLGSLTRIRNFARLGHLAETAPLSILSVQTQAQSSSHRRVA